MNEVLAKFKQRSSSASFHWADDTCKEWDLAKREQNAALKIFDDNPGLQDEMREIANGALWSLSKERPIK